MAEPPARDRIDDWDEAETPRQVPTPPTAWRDAGTAPPVGATAEEVGDKPALTWRQMVRGAPTWVWAISCLSLGSLCGMMFVVLLLAATIK